MASRKAFLLRIDRDLWHALEKWAADELRSVNGQVEYLLSRAVREAGRGRMQGRPLAQGEPTPPANDGRSA